MGVYLRAKFEVSSIILTSFRQGVILPPTPTFTSKGTTKKPTQIRVNLHKMKQIFSGPKHHVYLHLDVIRQTMDTLSFIIFCKQSALMSRKPMVYWPVPDKQASKF